MCITHYRFFCNFPKSKIVCCSNSINGFTSDSGFLLCGMFHDSLWTSWICSLSLQQGRQLVYVFVWLSKGLKDATNPLSFCVVDALLRPKNQHDVSRYWYKPFPSLTNHHRRIADNLFFLKSTTHWCQKDTIGLCLLWGRILAFLFMAHCWDNCKKFKLE